LNLGELDAAVDVARNADKLLPMEMAGRHDEARELFESFEGLIYDEGTLRSVGDWMLFRDRPDELIAFLEQLAGPGKDWIADQPRPDQLWGAGHMTNVAYALQETDRSEDAQRVLAETREILDKQADYGANNLFYWWNVAEYAALTGDVDAMLDYLHKTIDMGLYSTSGFFTAPFNRYRDNAEFIELERESMRRANAERRKLDMLEV
jgi:hypothetical protein